MLFWGIAVGWLVFVASGCVDLVGDSDVRWKETLVFLQSAQRLVEFRLAFHLGVILLGLKFAERIFLSLVAC
jgi:hypothetical protein